VKCPKCGAEMVIAVSTAFAYTDAYPDIVVPVWCPVCGYEQKVRP